MCAGSVAHGECGIGKLAGVPAGFDVMDGILKSQSDHLYFDYSTAAAPMSMGFFLDNSTIYR
jgi:hypothetical protein